MLTSLGRQENGVGVRMKSLEVIAINRKKVFSKFYADSNAIY